MKLKTLLIKEIFKKEHPSETDFVPKFTCAEGF